MSSNFFQRRVIVKNAKPNADINAATLPIIRPIEIPSQTMITTPTKAAIMDIHVTFRTCSLRSSQPKTAAKKGAAANKNIAFATDVVWIAKMPPEKAKTICVENNILASFASEAGEEIKEENIINYVNKDKTIPQMMIKTMIKRIIKMKIMISQLKQLINSYYLYMTNH